MKKLIGVNGYILAGGKSSRMGIDKGLMLLDGKTMIKHVIDALEPVVDKIVIVSSNNEYENFGFEVICDLIKDIGPAGGIHSALSHTSSGKIFIVSCDMPFVNSDAIQSIVNSSTQAEITLPILHQKIEPMFGVYSKSCLTKWEILIEKGIIKLQEIAEQFDLMKLNVDENKDFNELNFKNINTKYDFNDAIQIFNNMVINIIAFGQIADTTGKANWKLSGVKNTDELSKILETEFPSLSAIKYKLAVNKNIIQNNTVLSDEDTVALLPPFSGG